MNIQATVRSIELGNRPGSFTIRVVDSPLEMSEANRDQAEVVVNKYLLPRITISVRKRAPNFFQKAFGVPSPVIRVKFAGTSPTAGAVLGAKYDASGLGIAEAVGSRETIQTLGKELQRLELGSLGVYLSPARVNEHTEQMLVMEALRRTGLTVFPTKTWDVPEGSLLWAHADASGFSEGVERSLLWTHDSGGDRSWLIGLNAVSMSTIARIEDLWRNYPDGCTVKPVTGRNGQNIIMCPPIPIHRFDAGHWRAVEDDLQHIIGTSSYLVQDLLPPSELRLNGRKRQEDMVLFFVYVKGQYKLCGGFAMSKRSREIHPGPHTILRPVH